MLSSHGVARLDVGLGAAHDRVAHLQTLRVDDVSLLAIDVVQQRDASGAVGIVLDGGDLGGHAVLVALEVDDAVAALHPAALMAGGDAALVVATALLRLRGKQRLLRLGPRDLRKVGDRLEAAAGARRLVLFDTHSICLSPSSRPLLAHLPCTPGTCLAFAARRWPPRGAEGGSARRRRLTTRPGVSIPMQTQRNTLAKAEGVCKRRFGRMARSRRSPSGKGGRRAWPRRSPRASPTTMGPHGSRCAASPWRGARCGRDGPRSRWPSLRNP